MRYYEVQIEYFINHKITFFQECFELNQMFVPMFQMKGFR